MILLLSCSSFSGHRACSLSCWLEQWNSWQTLYQKASAKTRSFYTQWLLIGMGILCCAWRYIVIISVLVIIRSSREVHVKWRGAGWNFRWKDSDLFNLTEFSWIHGVHLAVCPTCCSRHQLLVFCSCCEGWMTMC